LLPYVAGQRNIGVEERREDFLEVSFLGGVAGLKWRPCGLCVVGYLSPLKTLCLSLRGKATLITLRFHALHGWLVGGAH